ncbi:exodeoxyribonuclease V alpha subunit [Candidatus Magnetomoraceae bacterium gMMP-15]
MHSNLEGQIERITYSNEENGYTIARVKVYGNNNQLVTVVGNLMAPTAGQVMEMRGEWTVHKKYGRQFRVEEYKTKVPASVVGIRKYLGSGLIKGIGPVMAKRLVKKFGEDTLDIIENNPEQLTEVDGIGQKRVGMIQQAWDDQKEIRDVMLFLQSYGVSSGYATKIFKEYGKGAIEIVRKNPYRLATDIWGIGFKTADQIAQKLGFEKNSEIRAEAGILYILNQLADSGLMLPDQELKSGKILKGRRINGGNVYYPYEKLVKACRKILEIKREVIVRAFGNIASEKRIVIEDLNEEFEDLENFKENNKAVYLAQFHTCETSIAWRLKKLMNAERITAFNADKMLNWVKNQLNITLAEKQIDAVKCAITNKVMIITGGPGTGKTTIIKAVLKIYSQSGVNILLAAPTGRAAKRMGEATGYKAKTIHRMLEYMPPKGFKKDDKNTLKCDLLIIDEASMIDTVLMHYLIKAVPITATLIMVGDINQLPSVGAGNVLKDIINSNRIPVVELNKIFRQARESLIIVNAHKINKGNMPFLKPSDKKLDDFYFIEQEDPEDILKIILELAKNRIPTRFGLDSIDDIQILTPMHRGIVGAGNLNAELQNALNLREDGLTRGSQRYRINDKIMQIRNNYDKIVFNGDLGRITSIIPEKREVIILFDGREITYDYTELDEITLAYAVSVHKSQGSEYPAVIIPVVTQHYMLLERNLIYTAITRGKKLVVMVGTKKALGIAVKNNRVNKRHTRLKERLM